MDLKLCILLELLNHYILVYFSGFLKERLIFYELFFKGPSALRKCALTAVRGLSNTVQLSSARALLCASTSCIQTLDTKRPVSSPSPFYPVSIVFFHLHGGMVILMQALATPSSTVHSTQY